MDRLLNTFAAAAVLGTTEAALRKNRCDGKGPVFVKNGRAVRYRETDIQTFIAGLTA